ncbi:MAG: hypothetical protein ACK5M9_04620, partial [Mycobacterium sp.]
MYLQSRTRRWLQALRYANTILGQGLQMMEYFAAHAHVPGARQISGRDKRVTVLLSTDPWIQAVAATNVDGSES